MAMSILPKFLTLKWNILRTIWRIEVSDGSLFCIFHALSFELNFSFNQRFPLTSSKYEVLAAAIAAGLMIGFWFGLGVVLAVKTLESLEYCIRRKC